MQNGFKAIERAAHPTFIVDLLYQNLHHYDERLAVCEDQVILHSSMNL